MRRFFIVLGDVLFVPLVIFALLHVSLLVYGLRMGKGQLALINGARPITEVLADAAVPDSVKQKLQLILDIRAFAFDSLGLTRNDNYTNFYDQRGQPAIYVVTACEKFRLEPYRWDYSVLGKMPYKGFFEKEKAEAELKRLRAEGYDADLGGAAGWSTLGWLPDPVLSQMLRYPEGDLAELIIHELTHGTVFVKNDVDYNENLASFVGYKGALAFLTKRYGACSPQLLAYEASRTAEAQREMFLLRSAQSLDSLYKALPSTCDSRCKLEQRKRVFARIVSHAQTQHIGDSLYATRLNKRLNKSGNTVLMHAVRYSAKQADFETEFRKSETLPRYIRYLKTRFGKA